MMGKARTNPARSKYIKVVLVEAAGTAAASGKGALVTMATFKDPVRCFAPIEVIERLLEIRAEAGFRPAIYLLSPDDLADYLDAFGFDVYSFSDADAEFSFGDYRASLAPGGDNVHGSPTAH